MKAAVLLDSHKMVIEDVPKPVAGEGEVLLKVDSCGICGTDLEFYETGSYNPDWVLGHECSGVIEEIGPGVEGWAIGERVTVNDLFSCGECDFCRRGLESICANAANLGIHWPGAFAEYTKAPQRSLFKLPENVSMEEGALVPTLAVGRHVFMRAKPGPETKTLVIGAGPVGLGVVAALGAYGANTFVVADTNPVCRKAATSLGAPEVVNPGAEDLASRVESILSGPPEVVFECVGIPDTILQSMELVDRGGTTVIVGNCFEEITLHPITWILKEINIKASQGTGSDDFEEAIRWIAERRLDSSVFITRTITLDDLPKTMEELTRQKNDIKIMVKV
jgi:(R,R)-butanediol dehydrogenase/meso-butanediol dehydrogenase/diacetyl reductase